MDTEFERQPDKGVAESRNKPVRQGLVRTWLGILAGYEIHAVFVQCLGRANFLVMMSGITGTQPVVLQ